MKLVDLLPLKEESTGAFGATSEELADMYSLKMLQQMRDEVMMDMENDPSVEPEGGSQADYYGGTLNGLDKAIAIKRGETKDVPYDVAIGRMTQDEYDKMMSTVKPDRASFEKSSKFDRMNETTEKAWNAIDVSRKAEKEISNKEWNERTSKKLDMLKKLNDAGKFKKDFDDERLQGWVDQNYSWQKLSKQFKLNEIYENTPTSVTDKDLDDLEKIVLKYVKDPDDAEAEVQRFDDGGFDAMSDMVTANLLSDPEYDKWYNNLHSIKETNNVRKVVRKIVRENFDDRLRSMMGADDFKKATNPKLAKLINNAIMSIDPNMSYKDFAKGVAQVLIDEYGVQNYEPFISELKKALDSTLG